MIVADTGAMIALIDRDEKHHRVLRKLYDATAEEWLLPWAILPEVNYLLASRLGARVQGAFLADLTEGAFQIEWGDDRDLIRAVGLCRQQPGLNIGLVDGVVIAIAERRRAEVIATLDLRHFAAVPIKGNPKLWPRDA